MALLRDTTGMETALRTRHLIGRSRSMHTVISEPEVSGQHAALSWVGHHWVVRDLGSRNGTLVNDTRIETGVDVALKRGDTLSFGGSRHALTLSCEAPPSPFAICAGEQAMGEGQHLALPSGDDPVALIHFEPEIGWTLSMDEENRGVQDGETVVVQDRTWTLALPETLAPTADIGGRPTLLNQVALELSVSPDEEFVAVRVVLPESTHTLPARAHHYILLVLARLRVRDQQAGDSPQQQGWIYNDRLQQMLKMSANRVNLCIFRLRREMEGLEILDAQELIQRRTTTQQLRLGVERITIQVL